ncbi:phage head-tail connector protein [Paenibacillus sp. sptzw28]|uniref:head-tail connector protein n=1 Tax=Paenibacillus sp. sptzw28 TaxID=715179 RepID=UPI001C6EBCD8|nr:phage head-tail connector protein [Paenibacillus sp. sptzw28]QYR20805.1 phage head-tail connector protein [Paenibacillus sp. sptzw28]
MAGIKVITQPAVEPVSLGDVKTQLRYDVDDTSPDAILTPLITAAREWSEGYLNRALITQTLELALDEWPCENAIELPRPLLQSVTSLTYTDSDGATTTWDAANYIVDDYSFVGRVVKKWGIAWPSVQLAVANGIKVRFVAGYGNDATAVPLKIRQAIILLVMHWFENGMCDAPAAVVSLLSQERWYPV